MVKGDKVDSGARVRTSSPQSLSGLMMARCPELPNIWSTFQIPEAVAVTMVVSIAVLQSSAYASVHTSVVCFVTDCSVPSFLHEIISNQHAICLSGMNPAILKGPLTRFIALHLVHPNVTSQTCASTLDARGYQGGPNGGLNFFSSTSLFLAAFTDQTAGPRRRWPLQMGFLGHESEFQQRTWCRLPIEVFQSMGGQEETAESRHPIIVSQHREGMEPSAQPGMS